MREKRERPSLLARPSRFPRAQNPLSLPFQAPATQATKRIEKAYKHFSTRHPSTPLEKQKMLIKLFRQKWIMEAINLFCLSTEVKQGKTINEKRPFEITYLD